MTNIKFHFIISRWSNFYFFISNLSEWHFSCRKIYNEHWIKATGTLTKEEKNELGNFSLIRKEYPDTKSIFEKAFFTSVNPFAELTREISQEKIDLIKKTFRILTKKFDVIYNQDLPLLKKWEEKLSNQTDNKLNKNIIKKLENFYNVLTPKNLSMICYLLISPIGHGGMVNINDFSITQELSHYPLEKLTNILAAIWHEIIHLFFDKKFLQIFLREYFHEDMKKVFIYKELIASSLFPGGILGQQFFNQTFPKILYSQFNLKETTTQQIFELSQKYVEQNKFIDKKYIDKLGILINS